MKSKLAGWLMGAVFVLVVIAVASRIGMVRSLVFGSTATKAA